MKNWIVIMFIGSIFSGCSLMNPGYLSNKPDIEKLLSYKSTLKDVENSLGSPAISSINFGNEITYKYFYNISDASVDTGLMIKGNYTEGCKDCGKVVATFAWKGEVGDYKKFLIRGLSVSDKQMDAEISKGSVLLTEKKFKEAYYQSR